MPLTISGTQIGPWNSQYFGGGYTSTAGTWSLALTGYIRSEGGLIIQWGDATTTNTIGRYSNTYYFPISFPTLCLSVVMSEASSSGWGTGQQAGNNGGTATVYAPTVIGASGFSFEAAWMSGYTSYYSAGLGGSWYAVGY